MKKYALIIGLFLIPLFAISQHVNLITIDQLNERLSKGGDTTYVINFWATWCGPCVKELPAYVKFGADFKTEKARLLLISVDFKSELNTSLLPFIKSKKLQQEVFLLDEKDPQEYVNRIDSTWSGAIPATLFVKKDKKLLFEKNFTYDELVKEYNSFKTGL